MLTPTPSECPDNLHALSQHLNLPRIAPEAKEKKKKTKSTFNPSGSETSAPWRWRRHSLGCLARKTSLSPRSHHPLQAPRHSESAFFFSPQKSVPGLISLCKVTHSSRTAETVTHKRENTGCSWQGGEKTQRSFIPSRHHRRLCLPACPPPDLPCTQLPTFTPLSHYLMTSPSVLIGNYFAGFNAFIQTVSVESGEED